MRVQSRSGEGIPFKRRERRPAGKAEPMTDSETSARMSRVPRRDTAPELLVRRMATSAGLHYRTRNSDLPGSPDLANRRQHWAIFVHGCYWHQHAGCSKASVPKRNRSFWRAKFRANRQRDQMTQRALLELGYMVTVIWECDATDEGLIREKLGRIPGHHS
jgi:DNA mismatch endonuclease (patch repair protein)